MEGFEQTDDVWGMLGKLLRTGGVYPRVEETFYRVVSQVVLLFGSETWVLSSVLERKLEFTHTDFMRQMTGNWERQKEDRRWLTPR